MLWANGVRFGVEIDEIAASHVDGADAQTDCACIDTIEVDKSFERAPQLTGVVIARGVRSSRWRQPWRRGSRCEESGRAGNYREARVQLVQPRARSITRRPVRPFKRAAPRIDGDALPEPAQFFDARFRRVSGNDRAVDGTDRDASNPIGINASLSQRFVDSGLIGAERAAALQHERDAFEGKILFHHCSTWLDPNIHSVFSSMVTYLGIDNLATASPRHLSRRGRTGPDPDPYSGPHPPHPP